MQEALLSRQEAHRAAQGSSPSTASTDRWPNAPLTLLRLAGISQFVRCSAFDRSLAAPTLPFGTLFVIATFALAKAPCSFSIFLRGALLHDRCRRGSSFVMFPERGFWQDSLKSSKLAASLRLLAVLPAAATDAGNGISYTFKELPQKGPSSATCEKSNSPLCIFSCEGASVCIGPIHVHCPYTLQGTLENTVGHECCSQWS